MASSGAIKAGRAFVELFADDSKLVRGLKAASKKLKAWGDSVSAAGRKLFAVGGLAKGAMLGAAKEFADMGSQINDMSARTGVAVNVLSELGYAAKQSGASIEDVETGIRKMGKLLSEAKGGEKGPVDTLAKLGLKAKQLEGLTADEQLDRIGQALQRIPDVGTRAAVAMEVFGKTGTKLLPMLADLGDLRQRARDLGLVISPEEAAAADELGDRMDDLAASIKMVVFQIGSALATEIKNTIDKALSFIKTIIDWIKANQDFVVYASKMATAIAAVGAALMVIGPLIGVAGTLLTALATIAGIVSTVLAALFTTIPGLIIVALASVGALAGALGGIWIGMDKIKAAIGRVWELAKQAFRDIARTVGAAVNALMRGDWEAAWAVLTTGFKAAWQVAMTYAMEAFYGLKDWLINAWWDAWAGFRMAANNAIAWLLQKWVDVKETITIGLLTAVEMFAAKFAEALAGMVEGMKNAITGLMASLPFGGVSQQQAADRRQDAKAERMHAVNNARDSMRKEKDKARKGFDEERKKITEQTETRNTEIADQRAQERADRAAATGERMKPWEDARDEAVSAWKEALAKAEGGTPEGLKFWQKQKPQIPDIEEIQKTKGSSIAGTFNAAAVRGMGAGGPLERIAAAAEKQIGKIEDLRKIDEQILQEMKLNQLEFVA